MRTALDKAASANSDQPNERELDAQLHCAAYALGVIGGPESLDILAQLLSDAEPSVRYNAATGLARHGDPRAVPRLVEMLDVRASGTSSSDTLDEIATTTILQNALRATVQLAESNPNADLRGIKEAIDRLNADSQLSGTVRRGIELDLKAALRYFQSPSTAARPTRRSSLHSYILTTVCHPFDVLPRNATADLSQVRL